MCSWRIHVYSDIYNDYKDIILHEHKLGQSLLGLPKAYLRYKSLQPKWKCEGF